MAVFVQVVHPEQRALEQKQVANLVILHIPILQVLYIVVTAQISIGMVVVVKDVHPT